MKRLQRKREKGWRMLPNSRCIDRSSRWGNPYKIWDSWLSFGWVVTHIPTGTTFSDTYDGYWSKEEATQKAVELFRDYAITRLEQEPEWLDPLRGLDNLYCTCQEEAPCHADVIIELLESNDKRN